MLELSAEYLHSHFTLALCQVYNSSHARRRLCPVHLQTVCAYRPTDSSFYFFVPDTLQVDSEAGKMVLSEKRLAVSQAMIRLKVCIASCLKHPHRTLIQMHSQVAGLPSCPVH